MVFSVLITVTSFAGGVMVRLIMSPASASDRLEVNIGRSFCQTEGPAPISWRRSRAAARLPPSPSTALRCVRTTTPAVWIVKVELVQQGPVARSAPSLERQRRTKVLVREQRSVTPLSEALGRWPTGSTRGRKYSLQSVWKEVDCKTVPAKGAALCSDFCRLAIRSRRDETLRRTATELFPLIYPALRRRPSNA